jgi:predicted transcriptional regulator
MTDVLIRNLSADTVSQIDTLAARAGVSRVEYLRRTVEHEAARTSNLTTGKERWLRFAELTAELNDPEFEARAWGHD